uniref:Uncharacterized protein n=1 Tax=Anguilla anguilla TaxID=7936 RepID=A0A0E9XWF8_ANGAN
MVIYVAIHTVLDLGVKYLKRAS